MFHQVLIIEYSDVTVSKLGIYQGRPKGLGIKAFSGVRKIHFNPHLSQGVFVPGQAFGNEDSRSADFVGV